MGFKLTCRDCGKAKRFGNEKAIVKKGWTSVRNPYSHPDWLCPDCKEKQ